MNKYLVICLLFILFFCGCSQTKDNKPPEENYVVHQETLHKTLHFTGTIQPIKETLLTNSIDGVIAIAHHHYGQKIQKNDLIFTLNSESLQKQYNETLTEYLKAKDNWNIAESKFRGTQELWNSGLIAKNNYLSEESNVKNIRLGLMQATFKLAEILEKIGDDNYKDLQTLSFSDFEKVRQTLNKKHNTMQLKAPDNGVLLYPPRSADDQNTQFSVGTQVKAGQALALIGDLTGIRIEIDVPEVDIDKIHPGIAAKVQSIAFPKQELQGKLVAINSQASLNNGNALPSFTAIIEVKNLTEEQQNFIKVGMSASIEISLDTKDKILVPVNAVKQINGQNIVKIKDKDGVIHENTILTGATWNDKVIVDKGLKPGDNLVFNVNI